MDFIIRCQSCKKDLSDYSFGVGTHRGYTLDGAIRFFCNEECYNNYWSQYLVEEYRNNKIYEITRDGVVGYIPYIGCGYYFKTLEDCKGRIDQENVAVVDMGMLHAMNNYLLGE